MNNDNFINNNGSTNNINSNILKPPGNTGLVGDNSVPVNNNFEPAVPSQMNMPVQDFGMNQPGIQPAVPAAPVAQENAIPQFANPAPVEQNVIAQPAVNMNQMGAPVQPVTNPGFQDIGMPQVANPMPQNMGMPPVNNPQVSNFGMEQTPSQPVQEFGAVQMNNPGFVQEQPKVFNPALQGFESNGQAQQPYGQVEPQNTYNNEGTPKKKSNKGLIIVLVIVLLLVPLGIFGSIFAVSMFTVTNYVDSSRNSAYVDISSSYIKATTNLVNEGVKVQLYEEDILYLIPVGNDKTKSCVSLESGGMSPYDSTYKFAYVGVVYDNAKGAYNYYFTSIDGKGNGIKYISSETFYRDIDNVAVETNLNNYAKKLQTLYSGNEPYESSVSGIEDNDIAQMLQDSNVTRIKVFDAKSCQ